MPTLHWLTREQDLKASSLAPYRLLEHVETYGDPDTENMLIQGDNLDGLKALLPYYAGKVKCIYIDPPYNTRSAFEHYDDNLEHTKWLSMMYPRLELLRELLSEDGSIWVSIDDHEAHYLKVIMDEIFGRKNFVRNIVWQKKYTIANDSKGIPDSHDHIAVYSKTDNFIRNLLPRTDKQNKLYKYDDGDGKGPWRTDNLSVKTYSTAYDYPILNPYTGQSFYPPRGRAWMTSFDRVQELIADNRVFFGRNKQGGPQLKRYLSEVQQGIVSTSWWTHEECGHNDESKKELKLLFDSNIFTTPKPERLIQRVLHIASNPGDLVLDSFLGSGTTAAVAHKMGRRYIGIEIGEHAQTHCIPRLQKVIEGEQGGISKAVNWQGGGGFRFYRLGEAIFDDNGQIHKDIQFPQLAAHVWFAETKTPWQPEAGEGSFLGVHENTAYYLLYNGILKDKSVGGGNVLTSKILASLPVHDGPKIIYGERCLFSPARLNQLNITFKHTPYDIKGR